MNEWVQEILARDLLELPMIKIQQQKQAALRFVLMSWVVMLTGISVGRGRTQWKVDTEFSFG